MADPQPTDCSRSAQGPLPLLDAEIAGWCRGIMDGDQGSIIGLAIRMEALGNTFAELCRKRRRLDSEGKLLLCLHSFQGRVCVELACHFANHVLPVWEDFYPDNLVPRQLLAARRAWLRDATTVSVLIDQLRRAVALRKAFPWTAGQDHDPVRCAAHAALMAYGLRDGLDGPVCDVDLTGASVFAVASMAQWARVEVEWKDDVRKEELAWQLSQVRELLFG